MATPKSEILIASLGYLMISTCILVDLRLKAQMWKEILIASLQSLIQLIGVGFAILVLIKANVEALNVALVPLFVLNGARIARKRFTSSSYREATLAFWIFLSMLTVTSLTLVLYWIFGVLTLKANSIIPLTGIVAAASMRSLSLAFDQYISTVKNQQDTILGMFALGTSSTTIFLYILKDVIRHITLPIIDMLKAAGVVHIPGVMVGLLVAGILPIKAAVIQFVIMATMVFVYLTTPSLALFLIVKRYGFKLEE